MPTFSYAARSRDGKVQRGKMNADNRQALIQMLQSRGLAADPASIKEQGGGTARAISKLAGKRVKQVELLLFTRQMATMVNAGLPLLQSLDILAEQTEEANFAAIIRGVAQDVEGGETFSEALRRYARAFPDLYVSMVRAGEAGGDLDGVLLQLADYLEATAELKRRVRSAMTYPVVAFSLIILMAGGLIIFVVPQFATIFLELNAKLPAPTRILIGVSNTLASWKALIVVAAGVGLVVAVRVYGQTPGGAYNLDVIRLRLPIFGKLLRKVAVSRFTRTLSTLTRSGVPILQAMEIVERTAGSEVFAKAIRNSAESVRNGETLADPLARSGEFPSMVTRMIGVGEKTGALEVMLEKIADFYDSEVRATVDGLTSLIEPILIMMMGIVVGGIVIALFLPILGLSTAVQGSGAPVPK
ncbi:MAG: type II secretion system F family protein [Candidatus Hydrogenedentota bacterium]